MVMISIVLLVMTYCDAGYNKILVMIQEFFGYTSCDV